MSEYYPNDLLRDGQIEMGTWEPPKPRKPLLGGERRTKIAGALRDLGAGTEDLDARPRRRVIMDENGDYLEVVGQRSVWRDVLSAIGSGGEDGDVEDIQLFPKIPLSSAKGALRVGKVVGKDVLKGGAITGKFLGRATWGGAKGIARLAALVLSGGTSEVASTAWKVIRPRKVKIKTNLLSSPPVRELSAPKKRQLGMDDTILGPGGRYKIVTNKR